MATVPSNPPAANNASSAASGSGSGGRSVFGTHELSIVLSHFDIGVIDAIQEFPRGSRKSPKLILKTDTGLFLLKRRPTGKDSPYKVAFCHKLQLYLAMKQFPLPRLIGTRRDNNSMLQLSGEIYELFEYIKGTSYDSSLDATHDSGKILALYHKLLSDYHDSDFDPPDGSYHDAKTVRLAIDAMPRTMARTVKRSPEQIEAIKKVSKASGELYNEACAQVEEAGLSEWPKQIVHSDWHPGNMLFRGSRVVAVIDYDTARVYQRVIDVANGALQFSIIGGGENPASWPDYLDQQRLRKFLGGYDSVPACMLSKAELRIVPWLMIEALIAEAVIPIANTGYFATMEGFAFLQMVLRKCEWMKQHRDKIANILEG